MWKPWSFDWRFEGRPTVLDKVERRLTLAVCLVLCLGGSHDLQAQAPASAPTRSKLVAGPASTLQFRGNSSSPSGEQRLSTRPVGTHVFKTVAEIDGLEGLRPGATVDVMLASLGEEGPTTHRILRRLALFSIGKWRAEGPGLADVTDTEDSPESESVIYPVRVIGLLVNGVQLETLRLAEAQGVIRIRASEHEISGGVIGQIWHNFRANLFQPLLLFFFMGFTVPLLKVPLEFPKQLYQSLTIYLLVAIGWHGGELMAHQSPSELAIAGGLVAVGFAVNCVIGLLATKLLQWFTPMRQIDAVTVGAYYGSDSAGTFVTCLGILATLGILHDSYMPILLAVMEIPGCLVGLLLVSRMRQRKMDSFGNMPGEDGYANDSQQTNRVDEKARFNWKIAHEVLLNPGLFLLFGGIIVGFISGIQALTDPHVVEGPNHLFIFIFKGALCLFLLEMGMTACRRLRDLKRAGWGFIAFGVFAPNVFATIGMVSLHVYSLVLGHAFYLGTYALFAVLCGAASYIAVPAVQRLAIPEASPTLPLAASLGLTFTWNVTLGIPIYIEIAKAITSAIPV